MPGALDWLPELERSLAQQHTELFAFEGAEAAEFHEAPLILAISEAFLDRHDRQLPALVAGWKGTIIPMQVAGQAAEMPEALEGFSPIFADESRADIVTHIVVAARTDPEWSSRWRDLLTAARAEDPDLLDRGGLERAELLLAGRPEDLIAEVPAEVARLIEQSEAALARRRRRLGVLAAIAAAVLLSAMAVALLQRHGADTAAAAARAQALHAQSDRLSRLARSSLASDPDLPVLLARRAYRLTPDAEARESLREALEATPWRRSYPLGGPASSVLGNAATSEVVVLGEDGSAALIDSQDGRSLARIPRPSGTSGAAVGAISADGRRVAFAYDGGLLEVRKLDPSFRRIFSARLGADRGSHSLSVAWADPGVLLSAWSEAPVERTRVASGLSRPLASEGVHDPLAVAGSPDGRWIALADHDHLGLFDAATMRPCFRARTHASPAKVSLSFDQGHGRLILAREESFATQFRLPRRCRGATIHSSTLVAAPSAALAVLADGAVVVGSDVGQLRILEPPAEYPAAEFPAATDRVASVATTSGGRFVTVGNEGRLRVWPPPDLPAYPDGPLPLLDLNDRLGSGQTRATWRPMLAISPDGHLLTTGVPGNGELATVAARGLLPDARVDSEGQQNFNYIGTSIRPVPDRPCRAVTLDVAGAAAEVECHPNRERVIWKGPRPLGVGSLLDTAVSGDGRSVAVAGPSEVELAQIATGAVRRVELEDVRAIAFNRHRLVALCAGNQLVEVGPKGAARRIPTHLPEPALTIAADGPEGKALAVGAGGMLEVVDLENGRRVKRLDLPVDFSEALGAELSRSGRLALVVSPHG